MGDLVQDFEKFRKKGTAQGTTQSDLAIPDMLKSVARPHVDVAPDTTLTNDGAMPGSFEGHPENLAGYVKEGPVKTVKGLADLAARIQSPTSNPDKTMSAASDVMEGAGMTGAPLLPFAVGAAPVTTAATTLASTGGQKLGEKLTKNASPETQRFAGNVGATIPALLGLKLGLVKGDNGEIGVGGSILDDSVGGFATKTPEEFTGGVKVGKNQATARIPRNGGAPATAEPQILPPPKTEAVTPLDEDIVATHNATGGSTFDPRTGQSLAGQRKYAVSMFPERSVRISGRDLAPHDVAAFRDANSDLLSRPGLNMGTWKDDKGNHWLDVTATTGNKNAAIQLAKDTNQQGVTRLDNLEFTPTGGTGDVPADLPSTEDRLARIAASQPPTKPYSGVHFSAANVKNGILEGARRGSSGQGQEGMRLGLKPAPPTGVYFYDAGTRGEPLITAARPYQYQLQGDKAIGDIATDPKAAQIYSDAYNQTYAAMNGKRASNGIVTSSMEADGAAKNAGEQALADAGYDGYKNSSPESPVPNATFMFGDQHVSPLGQAPQLPAATTPRKVSSAPMSRFEFPESMNTHVMDAAKDIPGATTMTIPGRGTILHVPADQAPQVHADMTQGLQDKQGIVGLQQALQSSGIQYRDDLSWRNPLFDHPLARLAPKEMIQEALPRMKFSVSFDQRTGMAVLKIDPFTHFVVTQMTGGGSEWSGMNMDTSAADIIRHGMPNALKAIGADAAGEDRANALVEAITNVAGLNKGAGIPLVVGNVSPALNEVNMAHEVMAHGGQNALSSTFGERQPFLDIDHFFSNPLAEKAANGIVKGAPGYLKADPNGMSREIAAFLVGGEPERLGLSPQELGDLAWHMFESMERLHGPEVLSNPPKFASAFVSEIQKWGKQGGQQNTESSSTAGGNLPAKQSQPGSGKGGNGKSVSAAAGSGGSNSSQGSLFRRSAQEPAEEVEEGSGGLRSGQLATDRGQAAAVDTGLQKLASEYAGKQIGHTPQPADPRGAQIADAYDAMTHAPSSPATKKSYDALIREVKDQWKFLQSKGYTMSVTSKNPYDNIEDMLKDIRENKHISVWDGGAPPQDHPLSGMDKETGVTNNTLFRAVHDIMGHAVGGYDFSEAGEENAFLDHAQMFSKKALPALTTETKGQASWFFNHKDVRDGAPLGDFPEQKAALLPSEFYSRPQAQVAAQLRRNPSLQNKAQKFSEAEYDPKFDRDASDIKFVFPKGKVLIARDPHYFIAEKTLAANRLKTGGEDDQTNEIENTKRFMLDSGAVRIAGNGERSIGLHVEGPVDSGQMRRLAELARGKEVYFQVGENSGKGSFADFQRAVDDVGDFGIKSSFRRPVEPTKFLTKDELARISAPQSQRLFVNTFMKLPPVKELAAMAEAGKVGEDWYERSIEAFKSLHGTAPAYFREGDAEKWANLVGATSPHQGVAQNLREALWMWKQWNDAGRPNTPKEILKAVKPYSLSNAKMPNAVAALIGADPFDQRKTNFKAPSFGGALGGRPNSEDYFVGDTHMADIKGVLPTKLKTPSTYYAMAAKTRAAAHELGMSTRGAQAAMWSFKVTLDDVADRNPGATPRELAALVTPERIAQEKRDFADIMMNDPEVRSLLKDKYGLTQEDLAALDSRLRSIATRPVQSRAASSTPNRPLERAIRRTQAARTARSASVDSEPEGEVDTSFPTNNKVTSGSSVPRMLQALTRK